MPRIDPKDRLGTARVWRAGLGVRAQAGVGCGSGLPADRLAVIVGWNAANPMSGTEAKRARRHARPLIYLVDDEPVLLDVAEAVLEAEGYRTVKFSDPVRALRRFRQARIKPVLLITDYAMGKMNGLELIAQCKQQQPGLKTILVSGTAGAEILLEAPVHVDRFLTKPHPTEALCEAVRTVLSG